MKQYTKQEIFEQLENKNEDEIKEWLQKHTDEEAIAIMRAMVEFAEEIPEAMQNKEFVDKTTNLKIDIGLLENEMIDEQVSNMMNEIEFQANMKAADEAYINLRTNLISHLLQNPTDKQTIELAKQIIEAEKQNMDYYEETNWKEVLHLLKHP